MATLEPAWEPIIMPGECAPFGTPLFQPVVSPTSGTLIVGGPLKLYVFQIYRTKRLWFSIPAHDWISGFTVQANSLYVQDGPVISGWNLTIGGSFAAANLETKKKWTPKVSGTLQVGMLPPPPDSIYELPDDLAEIQNSVAKVRRIVAWASLLEEADIFHAKHTVGAGGPRIVPIDMLTKLSNWMGRGSIMPSSRQILAARTSLDAAIAAAGDLVFSAPVVRNEQIQGQAGGEVFVMNGKGALYALDGALTNIGKIAFDAPARPHLTMSEVKNSAGNYNCQLYYVAADGGVRVINASAYPPTRLPGWAPKGTPQLDRPTLRYVDGRLFGGGILGTDFFAMGIDPAAPPLLTMEVDLPTTGPMGLRKGWWDYDVAPADKMILLNAGYFARQMSYTADAKERKRGDAMSAPERSYTLFWNGTGNGADPKTPLLMLEVVGLGHTQPWYQVYLCNPFDSEDPAHTPHFPPKAILLDKGALKSGASTALPELAWIRCRPVVDQQTMYCTIRSQTLAAYFNWLQTPESPGGKTPWQQLEEAIAAAPTTRSDVNILKALGDVPLPPLTGTEAMVAFALAPVQSAVQDAAKAGLTRLADAAKVFRPGPPR